MCHCFRETLELETGYRSNKEWIWEVVNPEENHKGHRPASLGDTGLDSSERGQANAEAGMLSLSPAVNE